MEDMTFRDIFGRTYRIADLGPQHSVCLVLPGCPVQNLDLLQLIVEGHIQREVGPDWRQRQPICQSVQLGPYLLWVVTHADPRTGARLTIAMSEEEFRERGGTV